MKLVDLHKMVCKGLITYGGILWDESDTTRKTIEYFGSASTLRRLSVLICEKYPKDFPSVSQLLEELIAVNNMNHLIKSNAHGSVYPSRIEGYIK